MRVHQHLATTTMSGADFKQRVLRCARAMLHSRQIQDADELPLDTSALSVYDDDQQYLVPNITLATLARKVAEATIAKRGYYRDCKAVSHNHSIEIQVVKG